LGFLAVERPLPEDATGLVVAAFLAVEALVGRLKGGMPTVDLDG
jgi:hypothetical protein